MPAAATQGDDALMQAFLSGDEEAFGRLYDRYDRQCLHFIRRLLGPAHRSAAEDVHQETWMAAAAGGAHFSQGKGAFSTWLLTIARNKAFDHLRRQKVAYIGGTESPDDDGQADSVLERLPHDGPTPPELVQSRQLAAAMIEAVDALPLPQREVFVLFAAAGMSLEEIAVATQAGVETVKSRLRYARAALKPALAPWRPIDA